MWENYVAPGMGKQLHSFLNPDEAYKKAGAENDRAWNEAKGYGQPYWQNGVDQTGTLNNARDRLMNPGQLQNEWAQGYETSPYAKQLMDQNMGSGLDAASAMGLNGSSAATANIQQGAGNIVAQDRQQYMKDMMEKYLAGIGLGKGMYDTGANTGNNLIEGAQRHGENAAKIAYNQQAAPGALFGRIAGTAAGAALGGAPGAQIGGQIGGGNFNGA